MVLRLTCLSVLVLAVFGCDTPTTVGDAGPPDAPGAPHPPTLPTPPELPALGPCAEGFHARPLAAAPDITICDPWPEGGPEECGPTEAHFVGEPGCRPVGDPCPGPGEYPADLPMDGTPIAYVRGGATGGDGSRDRPYGTLYPAINRAGPNGIVAIAEGTFDEGVVLRGTTLWGACTERVTLRYTAAAANTIILAVQGHSTLRNLHLVGAMRGVWLENAGMTIEGIVVDSQTDRGIVVLNATDVTIDDVAIRGTAVAALHLGGAATLTASRVAIEHVVAAGIGAFVPGLVHLSRFSVRDVAIHPTIGVGLAATCGPGAEVEIDDSYFESESIVLADDCTLTARGSTFASPSDGVNSVVVHNSRVTFERTRIGPHTGLGLHAIVPDGSEHRPLVFRHVVVDTGISSAFDHPGMGIVTVNRDVTLDHVAVVGARHVGVAIDNGLAVVNDLTVRDVVWDEGWAGRGEAFGNFSSGLLVYRVATLTGRRIAIDDVVWTGITVLDEATYDLEDVHVAGVLDQPEAATEPGYERGLGLELMGVGTLRRADVGRTDYMGVLVAPHGGPCTIEDLTVHDIEPAVRYAPPIWIGGPVPLPGDPPPVIGAVTMRRVHVVGGRETGISAILRDAPVVLEDVHVEGTRSAVCAGGADCPFPLGVAILTDSVDLTLTRALLEGSELSGLFIQGTSRITPRDVTLAHNAIGMTYWGTEPDSTLLSAVAFVENDDDVALGEPWTPMPPVLPPRPEGPE